MKGFINILRGPVTSLVGLCIFVATVYCVEFKHYIDWVWNGLIGAGFGLVMLFVPDKIPGWLEKIGNKKSDQL